LEFRHHGQNTIQLPLCLPLDCASTVSACYLVFHSVHQPPFQFVLQLASMPASIAPNSAGEPSDSPSASFSSAATIAGPTSHAAQSSRSDWHNVPKRKRQYHTEFRAVDGDSGLKLAKPFSKKARQIYTKKTRKLMLRRDDLDRETLVAYEKPYPGAKDWLIRDELLRDRQHLARKEQHHVRKRTRELAELDRLYRWNPSADRAHDYNLVRKLLWRFKRHLGPLLDDFTKQNFNKNDDDDEMSSSGSDSEDSWDDNSDYDHEDSQEDQTTAQEGSKTRKDKNIPQHQKSVAVEQVAHILEHMAPTDTMAKSKRKREEQQDSATKKTKLNLDSGKSSKTASKKEKKKKAKKGKETEEKKRDHKRKLDLSTNDN
ncbi:hypothetical protein F5Y15DRAFT_392372, partial [Xylariaceae sp. FL0016]